MQCFEQRTWPAAPLSPINKASETKVRIDAAAALRAMWD
jgi:DNA helicase II / ATP-dependent DNA helicase PcrA